MEQLQIEAIVRVTARLSAALFAAALILFGISGRSRGGEATHAVRTLVGFVLIHTIHLGFVLWLATMTGSENIRERGGWPVALAVAALFYLSAFGILKAWRQLRSRGALSRGGLIATYAGVAFIAVIFLNSYLARVESRPVYWLPTIGMIGTVIFYFVQARAARPAA